jgi:hypothetical protein
MTSTSSLNCKDSLKKQQKKKQKKGGHSAFSNVFPNRGNKN